MLIDEIKNEIIKTGYIDKISMGNYFHMKYKDLYNKIFTLTEELTTTYKVNLSLRARVIFLIKYDCNINLIIKDGKFLTFDRSFDDFIYKHSNSAKLGWDKIKITMLNESIYSIDQTLELINKMNNDEIFGRSKNRTLIKKNIILYNSILHYSKPLEIFDRNNNKFPTKIIFIRDYNCDLNNLLCKKCENNYVYYNSQNKMFNAICKKCYYDMDDFYPQKGYFKKKYGKEWEFFYKQDRITIKNKKVNSLEWFINKYGEHMGKIKYEEYSKKRVSNILNLSLSSYSKISQELFWMIYDNLTEDEKKCCFFKELNREVFINSNNKTYIPDFLYKNKIIEYDGSYWHNEVKDNKRNLFYDNNGYKFLVISDNDFNRQKKPIDIVNKCINFLRDEK